MQKCPQCGQRNDDTARYCENCGQQLIYPNRAVTEATQEAVQPLRREPRTIAELQQWYRERKLPDPEVTRFFIGVNYRQPRAFGIYQEGSDYIVYKNKDDGSRAIRYQGPDEASAVNELYQKLKSEIALRKGKSSGTTRSAVNQKAAKRVGIILAVVIVAFVVATNLLVFLSPKSGYYRYYDDTYYYQDSTWYGYDDSWYICTPPADLTDNYRTYYDSGVWHDSYGTTDFSNSQYYSESSSYDSDYDWDSSDSWDSGDTDWGSDW